MLPVNRRCDDPRMDILLVEDEDAIAEPLAAGLRREGFSVESGRDGRGRAGCGTLPISCCLT